MPGESAVSNTDTSPNLLESPFTTPKLETAAAPLMPLGENPEAVIYIPLLVPSLPTTEGFAGSRSGALNPRIVKVELSFLTRSLASLPEWIVLRDT